ncbi:DgyrCDS8281 [Dimorphilus gyrociliatus]|uniref:DgyrCDS8281 n=1 Tax=Dimorphilus gyrociliatus TaxID=2664684 RepID=A0A7I8VTR3_9ANNE|nr:DgyrCDS8281 [Dimorphilus gyrociliatus]
MIKSRRIRKSPNEIERLLNEERQKRRKQRLLQVRNQDKQFATKIRQAVKNEKERQLQLLAKSVEIEFTLEKAEKLRRLQEEYEDSLQYVGDAQKTALYQPDNSLKNQQVKLEQAWKAEKRYVAALEKLRTQKEETEEEKTRHIQARQMALEVERSRAKEIASLPPPVNDKAQDLFDKNTTKRVQSTDRNAFVTTYYHLDGKVYADKAEKDEEEMNAREAAELEMDRLDHISKSQKREKFERMEKADLRHKEALKKEIIKKEYSSLLKDLSNLQKLDATRRSQALEKLPKRIFLASKLDEQNEENRQRNIEKALEKEFMQATDHLGDLSLFRQNEPPSSPTEQTSQLSYGNPVSDHLTTPEPAKPMSRINVRSSLSDITNDEEQAAEAHRPAALSKLLSRIQCQRQNVSTTSESEVESQAGYIGQEPQSINDLSLSEYTLRSQVMSDNEISDKGVIIPEREVVSIPYAKEEEDNESERSDSVQLLKGPPPPTTGKTSLEENLAEFNSLREQNLRIIDDTKERQTLLDKERFALEKQLKEIQEKKQVLEKMLSSSVNSTSSSKGSSRSSSSISLKIPKRADTPDSISSKSSSLVEKLARVEELRQRAELEHSRIQNSRSAGFEENISKIDEILAKIPTVDDRIEKAGRTLGKFEDLTTSLHSLQLSETDNRDSIAARESDVSAVLLRPPRVGTSITSGSSISIPEAFAYESSENSLKLGKDHDFFTKLQSRESSNVSSNYEKFVKLENHDPSKSSSRTDLEAGGNEIEEKYFTALNFTQRNNGDKTETSVNDVCNREEEEFMPLENEYQSLQEQIESKNSTALFEEGIRKSSSILSNKSDDVLEKSDSGSVKSAKKRLFDTSNPSNEHQQPVRRQDFSYSSSKDGGQNVEELVETVVSRYQEEKASERSTKEPEDSALVLSEYTIESTQSVLNTLDFNETQRDTIERAKQLLDRAEQYLESRKPSDNKEESNSKNNTNWSEELKNYKITSPERKKFAPFASTPAAFQKGDSILELTDMPSTIFSTESLSKALENKTESEHSSVASIRSDRKPTEHDKRSFSDTSPPPSPPPSPAIPLVKDTTNDEASNTQQEKVTSEDKFYPLLSFDSDPTDDTASIKNDNPSDSSDSTRYKDFPELFHFPILTELKNTLSIVDDEERDKSMPLSDSIRSFIPSGFLEEQRLSDVPEEEEVSDYFKLTQTPPSQLKNEEISKRGMHYFSPCSRGDSTLSFEAHEKSIISDSSKFSSSIFDSPASQSHKDSQLSTPSPKQRSLKPVVEVEEDDKESYAERKKRQLMKASEQRRAEAMERARHKMEKKLKEEKQLHDDMMERWKVGRSVNGKNLNANSSNSTNEDSSKSEEKPIKSNPKSNEKCKEEQMKKRTQRLYSRLEEVKKQQEVKNRQSEYAQNRERAKAYSKVILVYFLKQSSEIIILISSIIVETTRN